jgi:hypothetical protein
MAEGEKEAVKANGRRCLKCGKILFDDIEVAGKFLKGQPITEDDICPDY